jgi:hypothetical protein
MRAVLIVAAALLLASCEHMYGGMDAGRLAPLGAPTASR